MLSTVRPSSPLPQGKCLFPVCLLFAILSIWLFSCFRETLCFVSLVLVFFVVLAVFSAPVERAVCCGGLHHRLHDSRVRVVRHHARSGGRCFSCASDSFFFFFCLWSSFVKKSNQTTAEWRPTWCSQSLSRGVRFSARSTSSLAPYRAPYLVLLVSSLEILFVFCVRFLFVCFSCFFLLGLGPGGHFNKAIAI